MIYIKKSVSTLGGKVSLVLRLCADAQSPHRGGEYFANNLRCWAHLNQASPHLRCTALRLCAHAQSSQAYAWCPHLG